MTLWHRAQNCIAQGALTNSKHPFSFVYGVYPTHIINASGATVTDEKNKTYIDYICGLGTNLVGYGNPKLAGALRGCLDVGFSHSLPTRFEVETAEALKSMFHFCEVFKFLNSGSEACLAAVKIARAYTGRNLVLSDGYHGWGDDFVSLTPPATGVPERSSIRALTSLTDINSDVACVIVEPVVTDYSDERRKYLNDLREACTKHGVILIFDEIITGYRFRSHAVCLDTNIRPDLLVIGKCMANGLTISAVGGLKEVMNGNYFISTTYAGEITALTIAKKVVEVLQKDIDYRISSLWEAGARFMEKFNSVAPEVIKIVGYPTRGRFEGTPENKTLFMQEACDCGFLFGPSWFYNFPLMAHDDVVLSNVSDIILKVKAKRVVLRGEMPRSPFAAKVRGDK